MFEKKVIIAAVVVGTISMGCVSIGTYEAKIRACRDSIDRANEMEGQMYDLKERNRQLESNMGVAEQEQEEMRQTIQTQVEYITNLRGTYDQLINELKDDIGRGDVSVQTQAEGLSIVMDEKILFQSGEAELTGQGRVVLGRIGGILKNVTDNYIRVDGHSDDQAIRGRLRKKYPSNWELSAARAGIVLRYFTDKVGIDPKLLFLASFGQYRPVADNRTTKGRELNRRVEITLIQKKA